MARASVEMVIMLLCLNFVAGLVTASGVGAALNIDPELGQQEAIDDVESDAEQIEAGGGFRDTLQGLYTSLADGLSPILNFLFYGPIMLANLGVPSFITSGLSTLITVIVALDIVYLLTNRGQL